MIYRVKYGSETIEFTRNEGFYRVQAPNKHAALSRLKKCFPYTRQETVTVNKDGSFTIRFRVSLDYRLPLLRSIDKSVRLLRTEERYSEGRFVDRYIVATVYRQTGQPDFLKDLDIKDEISSTRTAAVVGREVPNELNFVDYDICIYNYLELNSKEGYKSRVVRRALN